MLIPKGEAESYMHIMTIGVYGYTEETFRKALQSVKLDVFVDTRRKRGVRGSKYAFANSKRLQALLANLGIAYTHYLGLAPTPEMIHQQDAADQEAHIARHDRETLTDEFREQYQHEVLEDFDSRTFIDSLGQDIDSVLLFCIERVPKACHRSLLAERLKHDLGGTVTDLVPDNDHA